MYTFIVNPNSRSGLGRQVWEEVHSILEEKEIEYEVFFTSHRKHAAKLAAAVTSDQQPHTIVVLGGDGTINEIVNGIQTPALTTLGYIPTGSGNDFARGLGLPSKPSEALELILSGGRSAKMDIGELSCRGRKHKFAVSSGIGFDAGICHEAAVSRIKFFLNRISLGKLTYVLIALRQWLFISPQTVTVTVDDGRTRTFPRCYFIASMNQRYEGGGFMFAPKAVSGDGKLSVCVIADLSKLKMLCLLPTALLGKHTHFRGVYTFDCDSISIQTDSALPVHTDGEPVFLQKSVSLRCLPEQLNVIVPK